MDDLVKVQQAEIEVLRERLRQALEALAPMAHAPPVEWGLTATETRIFTHLKSRPVATKETLMAATYGHWTDELPPENVLESHISKLRKKIRAYGLVIRSERLLGYRLLEEGQA